MNVRRNSPNAIIAIGPYGILVRGMFLVVLAFMSDGLSKTNVNIDQLLIYLCL